MTKKTYKAPTVKAININATVILAGSVVGDINTGGNPSDNENYYTIEGYDQGWGSGSPD